MFIFQWKTGHISETATDTTKVTLNH